MIPPSSSGLRARCGRRSATRPSASRKRLGSGSTDCTVWFTRPRKCSRIHGTPVNCARWVTSCRASQSRNSRGGKANRFSRAEDVGPDVVHDVLVVGVLVLDDQQVVLAEHPARHPAEHHADLGAGEPAGDRRERRCDVIRSSSRSVIGRSSRWNDAMLASTQPARSVTRARAGPARLRRPVVVGDQLLGDRGELGEVGRERGVVVRLGERLVAGGPDGHPLGQGPVDGRCHDGRRSACPTRRVLRAHDLVEVADRASGPSRRRRRATMGTASQ